MQEYNDCKNDILLGITLVNARASSKFSGKESEKIYRNIGSLETSKQIRISPTTKYFLQ